MCDTDYHIQSCYYIGIKAKEEKVWSKEPSEIKGNTHANISLILIGQAILE